MRREGTLRLKGKVDARGGPYEVLVKKSAHRISGNVYKEVSHTCYNGNRGKGSKGGRPEGNETGRAAVRKEEKGVVIQKKQERRTKVIDVLLEKDERHHRQGFTGESQPMAACDEAKEKGQMNWGQKGGGETSGIRPLSDSGYTGGGAHRPKRKQRIEKRIRERKSKT